MWYISPLFGILYPEKSGNPASSSLLLRPLKPRLLIKWVGKVVMKKASGYFEKFFDTWNTFLSLVDTPRKKERKEKSFTFPSNAKRHPNWCFFTSSPTYKFRTPEYIPDTDKLQLCITYIVAAGQCCASASRRFRPRRRLVLLWKATRFFL
jgi:hypothetical protein